MAQPRPPMALPQPLHLRDGRRRPRGQPGRGRAPARNEGKPSRRSRAPGRARACARARVPVTGRREAADWEGARVPAGRRLGPRTPRRRMAASAPTAAAPKDSGQARPPGAPVGTHRPPPPQLGHPPGLPSPGSAREPWRPAELPCAPFPSGDLRDRKTGQGREGEEGQRWRRDPRVRETQGTGG